MSVKIGSNSLSLNSQRQLSIATDKLSSVSERLSSGMRINKASDDAAGLSIASNLSAEIRIKSQGIRNISDGISLLRIAEGALSELTNITIRISELAQQSSNGVYSLAQRKALHEEAESLTAEYNRITSTTTFNGRNVFSSQNSEVFLQAGIGTNAILSFDTLKSLGKNFGTGTFAAGATSSTGGGAGEAFFVDINNDGKLDMAWAAYSGNLSVRLGNGDGTFGASLTQSGAGGVSGAVFADFNGDGIVDFAGAQEFAGNGLLVQFGNGNGSFQAGVQYNSVGVTDERTLKVLDLNGDGNLDIATLGNTGGLSFYINNGNGTFSASSLTRTVTLAYDVGDINGDGLDDIIQGVGGATVQAFLSNGDGTFSSGQSFALPGGTQLGDVELVDVDRDGFLDLIGSRGGVQLVSLGNGNGTFKDVVNYATGSGLEGSISYGDLNGDGFEDFIHSSWNQTSIRVLYGNGDGSFTAAVSITGLSNTNTTNTGDINGDGVDEILSFAQPVAHLQIINPNVEKRAQMEYFNLLSIENSKEALSRISEYRERISSQLGQIGAFESRLRIATNHLESEKINYAQAHSRIMDSDVATDAAEYLRLQIQQQASAEILKSVNLIPQLALALIR
jgi:flagellin